MDQAARRGPEYRILREVANTDFLQAITLLATAARREKAAASGEDVLDGPGGHRYFEHKHTPLEPLLAHGPRPAQAK
jgi:hypothetical protein